MQKEGLKGSEPFFGIIVYGEFKYLDKDNYFGNDFYYMQRDDVFDDVCVKKLYDFVSYRILFNTFLLLSF